MMNANVSKVHFINTTGVSLNDRFTTMSKMSLGGVGGAIMAVERPRPRSNSVTRNDTNRQLIDQWDRAHALQAAMKAAVPLRMPRQRLPRTTLAQQMKRTMGKLPGGVRRLQRSNSFTDIATMNADRVEMLQRVRGRTPSISTRLGDVRTVTRVRNNSRGRSASRTRSTSRGRQRSLSRSNSQTNLRRVGSNNNLTRARSNNNLAHVGPNNNLARAGSRTNIRPGSRNGLNTIRKPIGPNDARRRLNRNQLLANRVGTKRAPQAAVRGRSRSRSRSRVQPATVAAVPVAANGRARSRSRKRAGSKARASSVNSRLGANRTNELVGGARVAGGRVTKRNRRGGPVKVATVGTRAGRPQKRENQPNRKGAGGKKVLAVNNGNGATSASGRRGRSRSRRENSRVRGRSASKNRTGHVKQEPKSREQLDSELDQYMANTKSSLDREMDQYMTGIGSSRI